MDNRAVIEKIMRNLAFEVETNSHNEKVKERPKQSKLDPLNVKIKVRKKEINELYNRGFISNNQSEAQTVPQKVRIITSDETIMSFDMFMEADEKIITQKHRKPIFDRMKPGMCLDARTDEDNQPYMPESQDSPLSKSDEEVEHPFKLYKNHYDTFRQSKRIERTFLGTKCKPGGCLDPPFDEESYSYQPPETALLPQDSSNADVIDYQENRPIDSKLHTKTSDKSKIQSKHTSISVDPVDDKLKKSGSIPNLSENPLRRDSDDVEIFVHREDKSINSKLSTKTSHKNKRKSKETSLSIIPVNDNTDFIKKPVITYSPDDTKKALRPRVSSQEESKQSVDGSVNAFFIPPKGIKRDSNDSVQQDLSKRHSYNPQSRKDKSEECLKLRAFIPITTPLDHISVGKSSPSEDIKSNIEIKDTQQRKPSSKDTVKESNKLLNIPFEPNKASPDAKINDTDSSNLISDTKKISVAPTNNEISHQNSENRNEEVTSSNIDNQILPSEHSKIPIENEIQPEKDRDTNHQAESNTNTEKILKPFEKVESFIHQSPDIIKIMPTKDKIDMEIERKNDEKQAVTIEKEPAIENQSSKIHTASIVSDNIYQHFDLDNKITNMTSAKDIDPLSVSEQKPKPISNVLKTCEENADINETIMDTNFSDECNTLDNRILPITTTPQVKDIFEQSHKVSIFSENKSQYSDLDNRITNLITGGDMDLKSVLEQKPELENNILEIFEENADVNVNTMNSDIVNMLSDENKTLDDRTLQITKPETEDFFEKQHKDSNVSDRISQQLDLDNTLDSNIVDILTDQNNTEDRTLQIKDPMTEEIFEQPQVAYPVGVSTFTIEQHHKVTDEEESISNDIQAQVIDVELPPASQILVKEHPTSDTSTQKKKIIDTFLDTHKKDMRDKDENLSGGQTQDLTSVRLSDDSVVTSDLKTISIDLAFHTYLKNKNERIFKTILNENDIYRYPNDSITVIKSQIKVSSKENLPELNIPIDPMFNIAIKIKSNNQDQKPMYDCDTVPDKSKTKPSPTSPASGIALDTIPKSKSVEQRIHNQEDQNDTALHRTLTDIYEQELVPLQTMIRSLKTDIDYLAEQRTFLKTKVICSKKSFHRKKISYNITI